MKKHGKKTIDQLIREYRKARGISQMKLAEMVGVSYQQIQKYEKGMSRISVDRLQQISRALGVPVKDFFAPENWMIAETPAIYGKMTDDEQLVLHLFREIKDKKLKKAVIEFMKSLAK